EVRQDLAPELLGRDVSWRVGQLPVVQGDRELLRLVLLNLLSNALKYSQHRPQAVIEVDAERQNAEWVVQVRDNGVGFDPRWAGKLFGAFQRLHRPEEFEGSGVGLATVKRIIARHGGRVWAESQPGEGATFCFALPLEQPPLP
ncbi:MAG: sensor histidine kinase, partial [Deinococcus sp.]